MKLFNSLFIVSRLCFVRSFVRWDLPPLRYCSAIIGLITQVEKETHGATVPVRFHFGNKKKKWKFHSDERCTLIDRRSVWTHEPTDGGGEQYGRFAGIDAFFLNGNGKFLSFRTFSLSWAKYSDNIGPVNTREKWNQTHMKTLMHRGRDIRDEHFQTVSNRSRREARRAEENVVSIDDLFEKC